MGPDSNTSDVSDSGFDGSVIDAADSAPDRRTSDAADSGADSRVTDVGALIPVRRKNSVRFRNSLEFCWLTHVEGEQDPDVV
jgi:hypothetical protein